MPTTTLAPDEFNDLTTPLSLLKTRRSGKSRNMTAPGPSPQELHDILSIGARVPDHGKIAPWRFVVIEGEAQKRFGTALVRLFTDENPDAPETQLTTLRNFATAAPTLVAVLSRVDHARTIPAWEQELSAGAACQNMLMAAHAMGYHGQWLSGWPAYADGVIDVLGGQAGDKVAAYLFFGTVDAPLSERPRPDISEISWSLP
ncbi:MAG: nitroreductase [Pseudomonadota bacterium]